MCFVFSWYFNVHKCFYEKKERERQRDYWYNYCYALIRGNQSASTTTTTTTTTTITTTTTTGDFTVLTQANIGHRRLRLGPKGSNLGFCGDQICMAPFDVGFIKTETRERERERERERCK